MHVTILSLLTVITSVAYYVCGSATLLYTCRLFSCHRGQVSPPVIQNLGCPNLFCPLALYPCSSFKSDLRGCMTCQCRCFSKKCPRNCPYGSEYSVDKNGCDVCKCKSITIRHICRPQHCAAFCPNGLETDQFGCQMCRCRPKKCGLLCRNFCPAGRVYDAYGCPTCTCKRNHGNSLISF